MSMLRWVSPWGKGEGVVGLFVLCRLAGRWWGGGGLSEEFGCGGGGQIEGESAGRRGKGFEF